MVRKRSKRPPLVSNRFKLFVFLHNTYTIYPTETINRRTFVNRRILADKFKYRDFGRLYGIVSGFTYLIFFVVCLIFEDQILDTSEEFNLLKCYWPKPTVTMLVSTKTSLNLVSFFGFLHVIYRYWIIYYQRRFNLDMISFLINEQGEYVECKSSSSSSSSSSSDDDDDDDEQDYRGARQRSSSLDVSLDSESTIDLMFLRLCHPSQANKERLMLRPNRTRQARQQLTGQLNKYFLFVALLIPLSVLSVSCWAVATMLSEQRTLHPGCDQSKLSLSFLVRFVSSVLLGFLLLLDSASGILCTISMLQILIFDLNIYWSYIMKQLADLKHCSNVWRLAGAHRPLAACQPRGAKFSSNLYDLDPLAASINIDWRQKCDHMDEGMLLLRATLVDFFRHVKRVDAYASILVPYALGLWLAANAFITVCGLQFENSRNSLAIRGLQFLILVTVNFLSTSVLKFKQQTESAYGDLCSLVAMDPSSSKRAWLAVMAFYTDDPRYAFTFAGGKIYSRLTYLTFVSYSITFTLLYENLKLISYGQ